ncbi:hypothetical protein [Streptomyces sp. NPDC003688]
MKSIEWSPSDGRHPVGSVLLVASRVSGRHCASLHRWRLRVARNDRRVFYDPRVGNTPAQKAAKAARGQQPKKRPGKAQREAIKRAQAAKKTGDGKPAAKKAVPLPRGSVPATYAGTCPACSKNYGKADAITKMPDGWGHPGCASQQLAAADREFARNKAQVESGETYRARKPSDWRRGSSPSSTRPTR